MACDFNADRENGFLSVGNRKMEDEYLGIYMQKNGVDSSILVGGGVNQNVLEQIGDLETDLEKTKQYFEHKLSGFCCYEISVSSEEELMQFIDGLTGNFTIYCNRSGAISRIDGFVIKGGQSGYGAVMRINYFYNKYPIEFRQKYNGVWSEWMNPGEKWDSYGKQNKTED